MPTNDSDPQAVGDLLSGSHLARLMEKARALMAVNRLLREILPPDMARQCRAMNLQGDTLTLQVDSAAIATRIRYETREILQSLRFYDKYKYINKIAAKVRPKTA